MVFQSALAMLLKRFSYTVVNRFMLLKRFILLLSVYALYKHLTESVLNY